MTRRLAIVGLLGFASGCTSLPWGGGGTPLVSAEYEIRGAVARQLGPGALGRAADRLARFLADLGRGDELALPEQTTVGGLAVRWSGLTLDVGALELRIGLTGELEARVDLASEPLNVLITDEGQTPCSAELAVGPGEWAAPLQLATDKLGRVQGAIRAGTSFDGPVHVNTGCEDITNLEIRLTDALAVAVRDALAVDLADALGQALGLDWALSWSGLVAADALGTGFLRASVRAVDDDFWSIQNGNLFVEFAVGFEAEAHPCMAPMALPRPAEVDTTTLPRGAREEGAIAVRMAALEQALRAGWIAGMACGDTREAGPGGVVAGDLVEAWPALGGYPADTPLRISTWPEALPSLGPGDDGQMRLDTGRVVIEVWADDGGRWRVGSLAVSLAVEGGLTATPDGFVWLDPTRVEVWPSEVRAGLVDPPASDKAAEVLAPLVERVVLAQPILRLPASARPIADRALEVGPEHVLFVP